MQILDIKAMRQIHLLEELHIPSSFHLHKRATLAQYRFIKETLAKLISFQPNKNKVVIESLEWKGNDLEISVAREEGRGD